MILMKIILMKIALLIQSFLTISIKMLYFKLKIDTFGKFEPDFRYLQRFQDNTRVLFVKEKYMHM